jgi:hypothetical protein
MKNFKLIFYAILLIVLIAVISESCKNNPHESENVVIGDSLYMKDVPPQPGPETWTFIEDLNSPLWTKLAWENKSAGEGQADLSKGVNIKQNFPDLKDRLTTAYHDLQDFLKAGNVSSENGQYLIETAFTKDLQGESFRLEITPRACRILAGDAEGIRRGIFQIEDDMLKMRGPFLQTGKSEKHPFIKRRISRCLYGPIKRPPAMRDELMDDVDYYPDQYLNRLAHDGVNGIWITVEFRDLVSTKYTPKAGQDGKKRLDKLRRTVAQCLRYGIKTYIFTIEPRAWGNLPPYYKDLYVLEKHPELGGVGNPGGEILDLATQSSSAVHFCPMTRNAQDYLYTVVNSIFKEVPDLGGMINISHGERSTTCASSIPANEPYTHRIDCPRCSKVDPWDVLYTSLSAMKKGMSDAAPEAELISWLYHADTDWAEVVAMLEQRMLTHIAKREQETGRTNPIYTNLNWHGYGVPFKSSEEACNTMHIGSPQAAQKLQAAAKELLLQRGQPKL